MAPARKRTKAVDQSEQIAFDDSARAEYLTGFHKRKQARIKQAQAQAVQRAKAERLVRRRELRQQREENVERRLDQAILGAETASSHEIEDDEEEEWNGIDDGLGDRQQEDVVDHEREYVDEDRYTTVTVEAVDVGRDGLRTRRDPGDGDNDADSDAEVATGGQKTVDAKRHRKREKPASDKPKREHKKKFRYESKAERRQTRHKQKAKSRAQAHSRKAKRE